MQLYFDANALIQAVEKSDREAHAFADIIQGASRQGLKCVSSELSLAELLVVPLRNADLPLIAAFSNLLSGTGDAQFFTVPVSRDVLLQAARIRAEGGQGLKLPDAIHLATAELSGCTHIISGDKRLSRHTRLPVWDPIGADLPAFIGLLS
ncbi:type II toxin-antitoxin system VapC family toxin [Aquabacter cavernae]|uniref:type II toxin-antitoxin system VapC family toxin n=1 Tax=Aquabacter cavernae TaxID=2496029 RepID=UPI000F8E3ADA|nr:type II toxin-antitoxin system VapC family toxin [Aquabacter cavernae]